MTLSAFYQWLKRDWAKVGFILSIYLFLLLFFLVRNQDFVLFLLLIQTPLYMIHEAEEYLFPGGFARFFNNRIFKVETPDEPLNENFIFFINVIFVWILLPGFGLLSMVRYSLGLWIPYFSFFAGVAHVALAIKARKVYNPGLVVSLLLNIPVSLWSIFYLVRLGILESLALHVHFFIGLGANALLPLMGALLFRRFKKKKAH